MNSPSDPFPPDRFDVAFSVPCTHRVRFTADVLGPGEDRVLLDVLQADGRPARVLAVVESGVERAADVAGRLRGLASRHPQAVDLLDVLTIDGGERVKNDPRSLLPILQAIRDHGIDRRNYVLAVGGGAFLDAVGLAAALAHRGVRLVRLPTTTMAQADSGVGVKNGVNFFGSKNWVGTFAVPWAVVNDATLLSTLPDRDWRCGFAEAVKVSLLKDADFFDQLCTDAAPIAHRDPGPTGRAIRRSAAWHLSHITTGGDPFEAREARPLDFGHWSAHRLEAMTGFEVRHGEAVAIGLAIDCAYSRLVHGFPAERERQVRRCLTDLRLPLAHPALADVDGLMKGLEEFRQHLGGRLTLTMLRDVGDPIDVHEIDPAAMRRVVSEIEAQPAPLR
jgi:3-dehydroquinate synthase